MNPEREMCRAEMKNISLNILERMLGELITRKPLSNDKSVEGKIAYGIELLKAFKQNILKQSVFDVIQIEEKTRRSSV